MDSQIEPDLSQEGQLSSAVLDALVAPVVVVDRQGRIVRFNRACERISGYPYAEAAGRRYWELLIPPEHIAETRARFEALQLETVPGQVEGDWLARDGSTHRISWRRTVLLDGDGRVVYIVAIGQEINGARPIVEEAHSLAQLPEQNPFPVLRISASGLVLYANSPASALLAEE
ncbi:MAG TPA: PAS domain-containing protein, partial [Anaerolineales bacterium]